MQGLIDFITKLGPLAIMIVIYAESGLMVGFFFPGDSLLFTAGFLAHEGILPINIHLFIFLLFVAAVLGNSTGYLFGARVGRKLFRRPNSRFFRQEYLHAAEAFYEKNGRKTIVLAMFVPIVRTFTPIVAGISHMSYRTFLTFNIIGAALWISSFTYIGYFAGVAVRRLGLNVEVTALIIIFLSLLPGLYHILKEPQNRSRLRTKLLSIIDRVKSKFKRH